MINWDYILKILPSILEGFGFTIVFWIIVAVISVVLSLLVAVLYTYEIKLLRRSISFITGIIRGSPQLFQLYFIYFGLPLLFNIKIDALTSALLSFILSWTFWMAEIYRGAIMGVEKGQSDAAKVLGFKRYQMMFRIILPQAIASSAPAINNQLISLLYSTSLLSVIGLNDVLKAARTAVIRDLRLEGFLLAGILYGVFNALLLFSFKKIEKNLNKYKKYEHFNN